MKERLLFNHAPTARTSLALFETGSARNLRILDFILLIVFAALPLRAATYYVATNGSDSADGSILAPWRTIQKAANNMKAGDAVNVAAGSYNEVVNTKVGGDAGRPIRFMAALGVTNGGFVVSNEWQEIIGFNINGAGIFSYDGLIRVEPGAHHLTCVSNVLNWTNSVYQPSYLVLYSGSPSNSVWIGNRFLNTPFMGVSINGWNHLLTNNFWSSQNGGDALRLFSSNSRVVGNVFFNWSDFSDGVNLEHADLIQSFSNNGEIATNNLIEGNLFTHCINVQLGVISDLNMLGEVGDWTFRNNIWDTVSWQMTINARNIYFYNNTFFRSGTNSGHPFSLAGLDTALVSFTVDTDTDTITVNEPMELKNGHFIKFIDPDGAGDSNVLPRPLTAYGGPNYYYAHVVGQTLTVHTNESEATNGMHPVDLVSAGKGRILLTSFHCRNTSEGSRVFNNIFSECGRDPASWSQGWFGVSLAFTNFGAESNLVRGLGVGLPNTPRYGDGVSKYVHSNYWHTSYGLNGYDPLFVSAAAGNFNLRANSPCIGAGLPLPNVVSKDFSGFARGPRWDVGAYQYGGVPAKKASPPGFTVLIGQNPSEDADPETPGDQVLAGMTYYYKGGEYKNIALTEWRWVYSKNGAPEVVYMRGAGPLESARFDYPVDSSRDTYVWRLVVNLGSGLRSSPALTVSVK